MFIPRHIAEVCKAQFAQLPVLTLTGPRQSGKTTLVRSIFPDYPYVNLELPDEREFAASDPREFLRIYPKAVIDEAQHVPQLFSYIQGQVDEVKENGQYVLTGSQNFAMLENITQSLAGRTAILHLLPLSYQELVAAGVAYPHFHEQIFHGFYPRLYEGDLGPQMWLRNYLLTYVERDVRKIRNIGNLSAFNTFLKLCAGRTGQMVNFNDLGNEVGADHKTMKAWLSVLEASFIVYLLRPYYKNFNKRLVKSPKLYFYDTGLACNLLGITDASQLQSHFARGALFENLVVSEIVKTQFNKGLPANIYFWREKTGIEVDVLIEKMNSLIPVEIKSAATIHSSFFSNLNKFYEFSGISNKGYLVYGGSADQSRSAAEVVAWKKVDKILLSK